MYMYTFFSSLRRCAMPHVVQENFDTYCLILYSSFTKIVTDIGQAEQEGRPKCLSDPPRWLQGRGGCRAGSGRQGSCSNQTEHEKI